MSANPNAVFLWTSREKTHAPFAAELKRLGIEARCYCIGWVDSKLYAQVFDVYLDSFPSGSGLTAVHAMAAGMPIVSLQGEISMLGHFASPVMGGLEGTLQQQGEMRALFTADKTGESYLTCAASKEEYVAMAQKLIEDMDFRREAGTVQRQFVNIYLTDRKKLALRINKHFLDIIEEKRKNL